MLQFIGSVPPLTSGTVPDGQRQVVSNDYEMLPVSLNVNPEGSFQFQTPLLPTLFSICRSGRDALAVISAGQGTHHFPPLGIAPFPRILGYDIPSGGEVLRGACHIAA